MGKIPLKYTLKVYEGSNQRNYGVAAHDPTSVCGFHWTGSRYPE